jgi:hypothetical protein
MELAALSTRVNLWRQITQASEREKIGKAFAALGLL